MILKKKRWSASASKVKKSWLLAQNSKNNVYKSHNATKSHLSLSVKLTQILNSILVDNSLMFSLKVLEVKDVALSPFNSPQ